MQINDLLLQNINCIFDQRSNDFDHFYCVGPFLSHHLFWLIGPAFLNVNNVITLSPPLLNGTANGHWEVAVKTSDGWDSSVVSFAHVWWLRFTSFVIGAISAKLALFFFLYLKLLFLFLCFIFHRPRLFFFQAFSLSPLQVSSTFIFYHEHVWFRF